MNVPFRKSVFLEIAKYPIFADFVNSSGLLIIPDNYDSVEFRHKELKKYIKYLHDNIEIVEKLIDIFLEKNPVFWGVVFTINKMASEVIVGSNAEERIVYRENFVSHKIKIILDCLVQARLPGFDAEWIKHRIDKSVISKYMDSFNFRNNLKAKIVDNQQDTVDNLISYTTSICDRFLPNLKHEIIKKLNDIMSAEDIMKNYFDRVVVINLDHRKDRWDALQEKLSKINWPFKTPERFSAYDGKKLPVPVGWTYGEGTWGCLLSHREVLARALQDGLQSILILEDDIFFAPDFENKVVNFLKAVPAGWDQLMFGGQFFHNSKTYDISPDVRKVSLCHRAHAYAVRGYFMEYLYSKLCASYGHVDHIMNTFQDRFTVYTPIHFLIGQDGSPSDISGMQESPDLMRNPPDKETPVFLIAPDIELHKEVVSSDLPLHFGTLSDKGANLELQNLAARPHRDLQQALHNFMLSSIWYARSVYPSRYSTILNPEGLLLEEIKASKGNLNLIYIESMDQLKEAIAKYPFGEDLPTQFPEEDKAA